MKAKKVIALFADRIAARGKFLGYTFHQCGPHALTSLTYNNPTMDHNTLGQNDHKKVQSFTFNIQFNVLGYSRGIPNNFLRNKYFAEQKL